MVVKKENKEINPYGIFLMAMLGQTIGIFESELEYDLHWEKATELYYEFLNSIYNNENKSEYDCIHNFITFEIKGL